jgi:hypothetical protein
MINDKAGVQDNAREIEVAELFALNRGKSRIDVDAFDACGNPFELKTTSKKSVSTARDLGPDHLKKWRQRYWIIAVGRNDPNGFIYERYFFLSPIHMEGWYRGIEQRFARDQSLAQEVLLGLGDAISGLKLKRLQYLLHRGMLLNDPNIPWRYVEENGIEILANHAEELERLVAQYPLAASAIAIAALLVEDDNLFSVV